MLAALLATAMHMMIRSAVAWLASNVAEKRRRELLQSRCLSALSAKSVQTQRVAAELLSFSILSALSAFAGVATLPL